MDPNLEHLILDRLTADEDIEEDTADLVLAACEGTEALGPALAGEQHRRAATITQPQLQAEPPGAYLASIAVQSFRGVGERVELDLPAGPGLTLVVGRNGSGKSSFAEGLELLLTGENSRWVGRTKVWSEGWRNLHRPGATRLEARMQVDGRPGALHLRRHWAPDDGLGDGTLDVAQDGGDTTSLAELGWDEALSRYRPFLSYNELGTMFDRLPTMYDALAAILGLGDVDEAAGVLRDARLARERAERDIKGRREDLIERLESCEDERARAAETALRSRPPNLEAAELAAEGLVEGADPEGDLAVLRRLSAIAAPDEQALDDAFLAFETARARLSELAGDDVAADAEVADLLDAALRHHEHVPGDECPVCGTGGVLDDVWRERARAEADTRRSRAAAYQEAVRTLGEARRAVAALWAHVQPESVREAAGSVDLDAAPLVDRFAEWEAAIAVLDEADGPALAREAAGRLGDETRKLTGAVGSELGRREDAWRPIGVALRGFLPEARAAQAAKADVARLKAAEAWVKEAAVDLQAQRLAPIADAAKANWEQLRQESNVALERFTLRRSGNTRSAEVDVRVDGTQASAFGVMSQGELHALAVSVFLPRAALPDSPFRFMVIDDPVQSMDPAKVDGLARVLAEVAERRQVIVFTHDERLPEAVRRLQLDATVVEVTRRPGSVVEVRATRDPVERYIADARALIRSDDVADDVARRVVPGFCRHAIEAGATSAVRRRRLERGDRHADVDAALENATTTLSKVALALFDDESRGGQVMSAVNNRFGGRAGDALKAANKGAHADVDGDLGDIVRDSGILARRLAELP
jgi:ABC-type lipoprotein export system ATPase subunit